METTPLLENATLSRAILRYQGAPNAEPATPMTLGPVNGTALIEADLRVCASPLHCFFQLIHHPLSASCQ